MLPLTNNTQQAMESKERERKAFKWGERTQKMMSFKVDLDLVQHLQGVKNKGRLINNLLRDFFKVPEPWEDPDASPEENTIEDTMP